ncbi:hypothetical protein CLM71_10055 [Serratia sp. MYb239]|uniref:hypothetical protein n=1 Tax=Serratia sp. MYb239 TaxID=2033438 RepID=UPI000CF6EA39|nr:hypothetical protein [Serratia sp. MYb239]AVJ17459.1 hypothetical protein CLM71_10055 [Serratia sp. MYb239]
MITKQYAIDNLPYTGRVIIRCENGSVESIRNVYNNEHVASFNALIDLAKSAGYSIVSPDGIKL